MNGLLSHQIKKLVAGLESQEIQNSIFFNIMLKKFVNV